ncbi:endonuclease 4-like [Tripterygium wilfordii]|uniref:endonuclease 4-like n=1 Tax=Tripterygium wilfordii TaxID=458696 RepID=UPI0018F84FA0|nr:endonuclease 4-like [Tripterygium wilfordii]
MDGSWHCWILGVILLLQLFPDSQAWGDAGHYAVCKIAEEYLTKDARVAVNALLPVSAEGHLANVCSWPDDIRRTDRSYSWSTALHFVNPPDSTCNYDYSRDCHDSAGNKGRCVTGAIYNYTTQLTSPNAVLKYNLTEALMFLSHFIGDIHQPLHVGFVGDLGGNRIVVNWYDTKTNLHRVWDDKIIDSALEKFYNSDVETMIQAIQKNITDNWSTSWAFCRSNQTVCPNLYASESISATCKYAYPNASAGSNLGDDYFYSRLPIVELRLAQGGVRLAAVLNNIFASKAKIAQA